MAEKKYQWHLLAGSINNIDWQENQMALVEVAGKKLTLVRFKDQVTACAHKCPHSGGLMADGFIDAIGNVVCPLHRYRFNTQNGRNTSGEGYFLTTYPIETREDGLFIGIPEASFLNW
jgi:3-phenylpropionate/trans-cinnamate dioxygenase ferredoxin subunit